MALSNKYLKVIIKSLTPTIFNEKIHVLFEFFYFIELKFNFLIEHLRFLTLYALFQIFI